MSDIEHDSVQAPRVTIGTHVQVDLIARSGTIELLEFDIVPAGHADFAAGFLGADTPLARAIMDQAAGSTIAYQRGDIVQVRITRVGEGVKVAPPDSSEKREAVIRQVVDKSDLANAISFALSFDTKWGDYDPEGLAANWTQSSAEESGEDRTAKKE